MVEVFTQPIVIAPADIDELGHVNNTVYLRWAQDVAVAHWRARASEEMLRAYIWVVTRHEVDYRASLALGDEAEARTWVADTPHGALWDRFIEIGKPAQKPAAQIKSSWCLLDAQTRRIKRVPAEIAALFGAPSG
ncbi:MAG TPA: acyl-CoA thioesterase [Caulobacterales bacterium]|nr:acyl-CoA thioesterase [Caulobacterales bacterium]